MTNTAAAALIILPITAFLRLVWHIYAAYSQDPPTAQRDDYLK